MNPESQERAKSMRRNILKHLMMLDVLREAAIENPYLVPSLPDFLKSLDEPGVKPEVPPVLQKIATCKLNERSQFIISLGQKLETSKQKFFESTCGTASVKKLTSRAASVKKELNELLARVNDLIVFQSKGGHVNTKCVSLVKSCKNHCNKAKKIIASIAGFHKINNVKQILDDLDLDLRNWQNINEEMQKYKEHEEEYLVLSKEYNEALSTIKVKQAALKAFKDYL